MLKFCLRSDPVIGRPVISDIYFLLIISYFKSFETLNTKQEYKAETGSMQGYCVAFARTHLIPNIMPLHTNASYPKLLVFRDLG